MFFGLEYSPTRQPHGQAPDTTFVAENVRGGQLPRNRTIRYRAFGQRFTVSGTDPSRRDPSFQGRTYDAGLGIYDYRNRSFDPSTGRFIQRDPVLDERNLYNPYAGMNNNPVGNVDPMGLDYTRIDGDKAIWQIEEDGWVKDWDRRPVDVGFVRAGRVRIHASFGGGELSRDDFLKAAEMFWTYYGDISSLPKHEQHAQIRAALIDCRRRQGTPDYRRDVYSKWEGFKTGYSESAVVLGNWGTFRMTGSLNRIATRVEEEDIRRGDYATIVARSIGKTGVVILYVAGATKVAPVALAKAKAVLAATWVKVASGAGAAGTALTRGCRNAGGRLTEILSSSGGGGSETARRAIENARRLTEMAYSGEAQTAARTMMEMAKTPAGRQELGRIHLVVSYLLTQVDTVEMANALKSIQDVSRSLME